MPAEEIGVALGYQPQHFEYRRCLALLLHYPSNVRLFRFPW